jgi:hypothetical protein
LPLAAQRWERCAASGPAHPIELVAIRRRGYHSPLMDQPSSSRNDAAPAKAGNHVLWLLPLLGLLGGQAWMTLGLFDRDHDGRHLLDDQPVTSGRHPLHLYHGYLGARALREHGTASCYDPAFNAGYPKTPVFDSGSRPAEMMLLVAGGAYSPRAYKIGLAVICAAVAGLLALGARGVGLTWAGTALATALGLLVWWGQPCQEALEAGDVDLLLATALVVAQAGMLIHFHRRPGPFGLLGVLATGLLGWFADPLLMALLLPLFLVYYLSVGARHALLWHVSLLGGLFLAVALNAFWLLDWLEYWWILLPLHLNAAPPLGELTFPTLWDAPIWGGTADRVLTCALLPTAVMGLVLYNQTCQRATARLLGLAMLGFLALAVASLAWEPLGRFGLARLLVPGLFFAVLPATHVLMASLEWVRRRIGWWAVPSVVAAAVTVLFVAATAGGRQAGARPWEQAPLAIGLTDQQRAIVETLRANTSSEARILWEDQIGTDRTSHWTALLPLLIDRPFVGGLDPDGRIEHTATGLCDHALAGRRLDGDEWTDAELQTYFDRYNIGWIVCWSREAAKRFDGRPFVEKIVTLSDGPKEGTLFKVNRRLSFVLIGSAQWLRADAECIALGAVTPKDRQVLLSLHYQEGMRVTPSRVTLERAETLDDRIDFVRLVIPDQRVARVTITWEKH